MGEDLVNKRFAYLRCDGLHVKRKALVVVVGQQFPNTASFSIREKVFVDERKDVAHHVRRLDHISDHLPFQGCRLRERNVKNNVLRLFHNDYWIKLFLNSSSLI